MPSSCCAWSVHCCALGYHAHMPVPPTVNCFHICRLLHGLLLLGESLLPVFTFAYQVLNAPSPAFLPRVYHASLLFIVTLHQTQRPFCSYYTVLAVFCPRAFAPSTSTPPLTFQALTYLPMVNSFLSFWSYLTGFSEADHSNVPPPCPLYQHSSYFFPACL